MTITITKAKLTRWIIIAVIFFCGTGQAVDVPRTALAAVACREFMADFKGYGDYSLIDVYKLRPGVFGVSMLDPAGVRETIVFDCRGGRREIIYRDMYVPNKAKRANMRRESVAVSNAIRLARAALAANDGDILKVREDVR
jgi:hypothetical protein